MASKGKTVMRMELYKNLFPRISEEVIFKDLHSTVQKRYQY